MQMLYQLSYAPDDRPVFRFGNFDPCFRRCKDSLEAAVEPVSLMVRPIDLLGFAG